MSKPLTILALIAIAAGAAVFFVTRGDGDHTVPEVPEATTPAPDENTVAPLEPATAVVEIIDRELTEEEKRETIKLPNGERIPSLNGVTFLRDVPANISRTPIVAIETEPTGRQYYLHEDGSRTKPVWLLNQLTGEKQGTIVIERAAKMKPEDMKPFPAGSRARMPNQRRRNR